MYSTQTWPQFLDCLKPLFPLDLNTTAVILASDSKLFPNSSYTLVKLLTPITISD